MDGQMDGWMDGWKDRWTEDGWMDEWTDGWMVSEESCTNLTKVLVTHTQFLL